MVGHSAGETVDVVVAFPEDYQKQKTFGEAKARFVTAIHEVKKKEVPALDDELAKISTKKWKLLDEG